MPMRTLGFVGVLYFSLVACVADSPALPPTATSQPPIFTASNTPTHTAAPSPTSILSPSTSLPAATPTPSTIPMRDTGPPSEIQVRIEVVASGLQVPWEMAFTPDGRIFIAQRTGTVRIIKGGTVISEPFAILPVSAKSEAGLLGLALHPQFQDNGYVYLYYTYQNGNTLRNRVVRLVNQGNRGVDPVVILDGIPGGNIHDGGRIMFGPDGKLYITTGDAGDSSLSQRLDSLGGKVLRLNDDGTVPQDNPFPGSPIYSLGHRNVQGLAWHPINGQLFVTEHGPSARDEVNAIVAGKNYGWPTVRGIAKDPRFADPIIESRDSTWAPSGATFYTGDKLPEGWRGKLFFSGLRGQQIHWISLEGPEYNRVMDQGSLFEGTFGRVRTVVQGPDGYLYFATNNTDGRGSPAQEDDRILRIVPNK